MQEAYDCADRDELEAYNSVKVMCGEVLDMVEELIKAEREACAQLVEQAGIDGYGTLAAAAMIRARGNK
jgi:regulator of RNase E activity RraB